ncbi:hypothetical protein RKE29_12045, partial [Streptomyces sp. B1866]|nr:hypothetical protein [Streptomyces sp. B1866]
QPLAAAARGQAPAWYAGAAASAACLAALAPLAHRAVPGIPLQALRLRAALAWRVSASLFSLDLRQAHTAVRAQRRRGARPALRLPPPRHPWLLVPWRDATGLLRAPGRLGWAAACCALAAALAVAACGLDGRARWLAAALALSSAYLSAAQLAEPARADSDDMRRSAALPYPSGTLALWHALVPGALLVCGLAAACAVCAAGGWWHPALLVLLAAAPACVAAALVSAYRGPLPSHLLIGADTPMGNTGPVQAAAWFLRAPLALLVTTVPALAAVTASGRLAPVPLLWPLAVAAAGLAWARRTARRLYAS